MVEVVIVVAKRTAVDRFQGALIREMHRRQVAMGLATLCIGGGNGVALANRCTRTSA